MAPVFIPFDGWSPAIGYLGEGWATALNLYPAFNSWRPWRKFELSSLSVAFGPVTGTFVHLWMSGALAATYQPDAATVFAGTPTRLFTVNATTGAFTDVSRAANYGAAGFNAGWRFAGVGNDIWATDWQAPLQRRTNNAGLFADGVTSTFAPQPRFLATVREHLLGANLSNAGRFQDEVVWSDADNATNFDPPTGTSTSIAGAKRLVSIPGQITGLVGGQYGLAFKRTSVFYLESTGTAQVFRPDVLSPHIGTAYPSSIINSRYGVFFVGPDGFYRILGLSEPAKISTPGVDQVLLDNSFSDQTPGSFTAQQEDYQLSGFSFPGMPLVGWLYRTSWAGASNGLVILYNPITDQWAHVQASPNLISPAGMLPYAASLYGTLYGFTFDGTNSKLATLSSVGANALAPVLQLRFRPANFETSGKHGQSIIRAVLPAFSKTAVGAAALAASITVESLLDPALNVWTTETRLAAERDTVSGYYPFMIAGRLFRVSITCAEEDFSSFEGLWVDQELLK